MPKYTEATIARSEREKVLRVAVGNRMRWARRLVEPSQVKWSKLTGLDEETITKVEKGQLNAGALMIREYVHRLRVTSDFILFGLLQPKSIDYTMQLRLVSEHPELLALQSDKDSSRPGMTRENGA